MDALAAVRFAAGALLLFVLPGLAWALAAKPRLRQDVVALAFWSLALSAALLVLYGTALGLAGAFTTPWLVGVAIALAATGGVVAWRRAPETGRDVDASAEFTARVVALRRPKVAAVMLRKDRKTAEADAEDAAARALEAKARRELYGR